MPRKNRLKTAFEKEQHGGLSSVGRASDCGSECRGFEPHIPHITAEIPFGIAAVFLCGCTGENPFYRGPREFPILGESVAQGENAMQGLCPQSREP